MSGLNFIGSYSGIDQSAIDQLMQAEKLPLVQLADKKTDITAKQNSWKDINTRLNSLFDRLKTLQSSGTFTSRAATSSNDDIVTMSASKNAIAGSYKVNVKQIATNTSYISGKIDSVYDEEGNIKIDQSLNIEGRFTIRNADGVNHTIHIAEGDSLKSIVENINSRTKDTLDSEGEKLEGTGISATIINGRIVLSDTETGKRDIILTGDDSLTLSKLGLNRAARDENKGENALFTVNGVEIERTTNTVNDAIEGITINLTKAHTSEDAYDTVNVSLDSSKVTEAVKAFVDQYNSTMTFIEDKLAAGDPELAGSRGTLAGDSALQRLHSSLRNMVTSPVTRDKNEINDISQLGVTTIDRFGQLQFDASKLTAALNEDPEKVINFFSSKDADGNEVGFAPRLNEFVNSYITSDKGIIKGKTESLDKTLKDLNNQIDRFNARVERKEAYYIKMFSALDVAMMQAESQMSWLQSQVSAMNAQTAANKR